MFDDRAKANLKKSAMEHAASAVDDAADDALGDSPIERLFFTALRVRTWLGASEYTSMHIAEDEEAEGLLKRNPRIVDHPTLIIRSQAQLEGWRVDFLIHAYDFARLGGRPGWKPLIVECDGHDFHERTKEQAARDRSRDRDFQLRDFGVLRFTGSEIYRDPWACAAQVTDWAVKGFP
jgi:very-short-patch-repair endonuclease